MAISGGQGSRALASDTHVDLPQQLGRYAIEELLGRGGMGAVYRARDVANGAEVALKTLEHQLPEALDLFEREYQTLASIAHPCVVKTFDYGVADDGRRFYTMELIEGQDLYALAPMPWQQLCVHLRDVAGALALLHGRGLVHRDISPRNIRIDKHGQARLLDFGALAPFGVAQNIVGTLACIAPEAAQRSALDGRSDLFSLGVTAYVALCADKPFNVGSLDSALAALNVPPASLLDRIPELPAALDHLIRMLLSVDPSRRPDAAADVIERLTVIASLSEPRDSQLPSGQFASPALVGRDRELQQLRNHLASSLRGRGTALVIEGAARIGKSRLAQELIVHARVVGAAAVRIEGAGDVLAFAAVQQLVRGLLDAVPTEARAALLNEPLVAELINRAPHARVEPGSPGLAAREALGALQAAIVRWIEAIGEKRPLVIVVDDAHAIDAASAGVVLGLAHGLGQRRILLALTIGSDASLPPSVERTVRICSRIKLRGLDSGAVDTFVTSIFGQLSHWTRLARWVEAVSGGNPGHCLDLLEELARRRVIKWLGSSWVLPRELPQDQLPASVNDAIQGALAALGPEELQLARLIALQRGSVPLSVCRELTSRHGQNDVLDLCNKLLSERIVSLGQAGYRVAHDGVRTALLTGLDSAVLASLHLAVGEALLAHAGYGGSASKLPSDGCDRETIAICLQAGWHLLHGGDGARGRGLLQHMGILLTRSGNGLADAVPALESALAVYHDEGRSVYERPALLAPLTLAGVYLDPRLTYRYSAQLLDIYTEACGIDLASRLARVLPKRMALYSALAFAVLRLPLTPRRTIARGFRETFLGLIGLGSAVLGTYSTLADAVAAKRLLRQLEPLGWFPREHPAAVAYLFQQALAYTANGSYAEALRCSHEVLALLNSDRVRGLDPDARRQFLQGLYIVFGTVDCYRVDDRALQWVEKFEASGTATARESAAGIRANYHTCRGEMKLHQQARDTLDVLAAQGGSPWRQDVLIPRCMWWVEAQCEDALGLKRSVRQLEVLARDHESLVSTHAAAHACYLADRGLAEQALERYGAVLEAVTRDATAMLGRHVGAYARVLRQAGLPERALAVCTALLERLTNEERELSCLCHGVEVEIGRALSSMGELDAAAKHLTELCAKQQTHANPLLHALSDLARAEVAVQQLDGPTYRAHIAEAERWSSLTQYSALLGLPQRLQARARSAGLRSDISELTTSSTNHEGTRTYEAITAAIAACRGPVERQQGALDVLIDRSRAVGGYLYLLEQNGLHFAAPLHGIEPPEALLTELDARVRAWHGEGDDDTVAEPGGALNTIVDAAVQSDPVEGFVARVGSAFHLVFLTLLRGRNINLVGVAALVEGAESIQSIPFPIIEAIAVGVYQAGDATIVGKSPELPKPL